jgi:hypothetical protein
MYACAHTHVNKQTFMCFLSIHVLHEFHWYDFSMSCMELTLLHAFIQGNCSSEPSFLALGLSGGGLPTRTPGQCVLVTDQALMKLHRQNLWLDSLHIQFVGSSHAYSCCNSVLLHVSGAGTANLWLTTVTLQGEGGAFSSSYYAGAIEVDGAQLYAEGGDPLSPFSRLCNAAVIPVSDLRRALTGSL